MIEKAEELGKVIGVSAACRALGVSRSSLYRARRLYPHVLPAPGPTRVGGSYRLGTGAELRDQRENPGPPG